MYSILCSKIDVSIDKIIDKIKKYVKENAYTVILPWAFPKELDTEKFEEEYFKKGERRYNKYLNELKKLGIKEENFNVVNVYDITREALEEQIDKADIIVLPGGNPEMFYNKVQEIGIQQKLRSYKGLIIGESAGAVLHLHKYFLTEENNFYGYFAYYNGFGLIRDIFEIDVHTIDNDEYINKLKKIADEKQKTVYAIMDDGAILVNRENNNVEILNDTKEILCSK